MGRNSSAPRGKRKSQAGETEVPEDGRKRVKHDESRAKREFSYVLKVTPNGGDAIELTPGDQKVVLGRGVWGITDQKVSRKTCVLSVSYPKGPLAEPCVKLTSLAYGKSRAVQLRRCVCVNEKCNCVDVRQQVRKGDDALVLAANELRGRGATLWLYSKKGEDHRWGEFKHAFELKLVSKVPKPTSLLWEDGRRGLKVALLKRFLTPKESKELFELLRRRLGEHREKEEAGPFSVGIRGLKYTVPRFNFERRTVQRGAAAQRGCGCRSPPTLHPSLSASLLVTPAPSGCIVPDRRRLPSAQTRMRTFRQPSSTGRPTKWGRRCGTWEWKLRKS